MDEYPHFVSIFMGSESNEMNRIKEVLRNQGRSQKWLSEKMNKTENTVSLWALNRIQPSLPDLYKVADILDVTIHDLLVNTKNDNEH